MFFIGLGTANPPNVYTQPECWAAFRGTAHYAGLSRRNQVLAEQILCGNNGIETRHLAIDSFEDAFEISPDVLHRRFITHAPRLASEAAARALADAGIDASAIDGVIISTCTGYLCPGLTSYVIERLGLDADIVAFDLVGQGCAAALPNWRAADALLASGRCERVLSICVEVCSAAFYIDNDPGVLISAALFGDGAAAAVLSREPDPVRRRVEWKYAQSLIRPAERDELRFDHKGGLLRNILSLRVPRLAATNAAAVLETALAKAGLARADIAQWIWHAGGRNVLAALQERIGLAPDDLRRSGTMLRRYGNLSSPFVFYVLQNALGDEAPGGWWWVSSFGAGFSCHGALLQVA
ncbi:MAG: type III polyketide synthase [Alphaproteobacteria bacterium]